MYRRAKFIWVPTQKIDHEAYFRLIASEPLRRDDGANKWVFFRKNFTVQKTPAAAKIRMTCDGRYQLFVNGNMAGRGPSRASPHFMRYDEIDISQHLKVGDNILAVLVHSPSVDLAWYETTKGSWQPVFGDGGLYADLQLEDEVISTDASWKCLEANAWDNAAPRTGWGQDFIEDFDARKFPSGWKQLGFKDHNWPNAQEMVSKGTDADKATGRGSHVPFPSLMPREIPQLAEHNCSPGRVVWAQAITPLPKKPIDQQLYNEQTGKPPAGMFEDTKNLLSNDDKTTFIKTMDGKDASILLAFNPYITGFPYIEIEASGGEIIEIAAGEALPGEFDGTDPKFGLKRPNFLTFAHLFRYTAKPGVQRFEKFEFTAIRALQITVRNAPNGIKIKHVGVRSINYPAKFEGQFQCDDPVLNDLWKIGRHTALQCMHDAYEDCPGREKRQWVGDGVIHFDISEAAFGPSGYALGRQFFLHAAESQRADGLLHMFTPGDNRGDGVIIPDFTLHWIRGVFKYWLTTGDEELVEQVYSAIEKALAWFARHRDEHGLLANIPFWHFIEWADIGRSGEAGAINALYGGALQAAAKLGDIIESSRAARRYGAMATTLIQSLNARHWNETRGAYVDEVDPETGAQGKRISQQTNALMIAFNLAPQEKWNTILKTITNKGTLKFTAAPPIFVNAPPFYEDTDIVRANTFYCHFLYEAFANAGRFDLALEHMHTAYKPMLATGTTTLWESFEPSASLCHVFSAAPVYHLSRHVLGVKTVGAGFSKICIAPQFGKLRNVQGTYPTPLGNVDIQWAKNEHGYEYEAQMPAEIKYELVPPSGFAAKSQSEKESGGRRTLKIMFTI
jgi:hypothetical protein